MKGSEKQIKWAQEIQTAAIKAIDEIVNIMVSDPRFDANNEKMTTVVTDAKAVAEAIKNVEYAGNLIDVYGSVKTNMTAMDAWKTIQAARRFTVANNAEQQKLLNK